MKSSPARFAAAVAMAVAAIVLQLASFPDLGTKEILVVDDEQPTLDFVSTALRRCGATVTTARSADEAVLAINRAEHDLVVADISMPGTHGIAMLRQMRARNTRVRAIAVTALADFPRGDFLRVLRKPIDPFDLASQVAQVIDGQH